MKKRLTDEQLEKDYKEFLEFIRTYKDMWCTEENPSLEAYKRHYHEVKDYEDNPNTCSGCGCNLDYIDRDDELCIACRNPEEELGGCIPTIRGEKMSEKIYCIQCGNEHLVSPCLKNKKFCNHQCKGKWMLGKPSKRKGKKQPQTTGDKNPAKRPEVRVLISKRVKETHWDSSGKNNPMYRNGHRIKGEKNGSWIDGRSYYKSQEEYGIDFNNKLRAQIRERDNHRCQECFKHQNELYYNNKNGEVVKNKLSVHHIDYNKKIIM